MDQEQNNSQQPQTSQVFKVRGMKTDFSESSFENSFAFENKNMRINIVDDDNTLLNLTNERGTREVCEFEGIPVGLKKYANDKAILITTTNEGCDDIEAIKEKYGIDINSISNDTATDIPTFKDRIYTVSSDGDNISINEINKSENSLTSLSAHNPLEIEHFADGNKDSFYIADGINNFKAFDLSGDELTKNNDRLEYNDIISGNESIDVSHNYSILGEFSSGVMVYCFAYVSKMGHKTGIIDVSDLVYVVDYHGNENPQGLEPNKRCNILNVVTINKLSKNFDAIEIYSLFRSSLDGEIVCKKVCTQKILQNVDYVSVHDLNKGDSISYQELLSRFNSVLIPSTLTQKNNTLFLGNIKTNNYSNLKSIIKLMNSEKPEISVDKNDYFLIKNQYFLGVQFQDRHGDWSPVLSIGDCHGNAKEVRLPSRITESALNSGYVSARIMMLDDRRIRNTVCEGLAMPVLDFENAKYGIDFYSPYFYNPKSTNNNDGFDLSSDIYKYDGKDNRFKVTSYYSDLYSPDIEFDENLIFDSNITYNLYKKEITKESLVSHNIDIEINGNIGTLYNADSADDLGKAGMNDGFYYWMDSIVGYQKSLQLFMWDDGGRKSNIPGEDMFLSLYKLRELNIYEKPSKYVIYTWQPSGSLNDSKDTVSILKNKRISRKYEIHSEEIIQTYGKKKQTRCWLFDGTNNNIPLSGFKVYGGHINHKVYPSSWKIDDKYRQNRINNGEQMWDDDQISKCDDYALATLPIFSFVGQPIEIYRNIDSRKRPTYMYSTVGKLFEDQFYFSCAVKFFRGGSSNSSLGAINFNNTTESRKKSYYETTIKPINEAGTQQTRKNYVESLEKLAEVDNNSQGKHSYLGYPIKSRVTNNYNRAGSINISYSTARHIVIEAKSTNNCWCRIGKQEQEVSISDSDIEKGQWIICSRKSLLKRSDLTISVNINERFEWDDYECLKTEPHSLNDENQVTCCLDIKKVSSYINPLCRYDNLRNMSDYNGVTSSVFNKLNMVYNQKNNFFVFMGMSAKTVTENNQANTIMYTDTKVQNESEDTYVNFSINDFYDIDSNVNRINKIINYNDKLFVFSDRSVVNVLYNENVVINTDNIQNLGLASGDKISGTQLLTNTYGCLNKWSIGMSDNVLYFNDDLNNKIMSFSGEGFSVLNESLGIDTLNGKLLKKNIWNPVDFLNTKLNIDKYSKDVHYTTNEIDISLNTAIGSFMSLLSYENVTYMEQLGRHSIAIRGNRIYALREGDYNYFFGKYEPYWTTVILNNNSLINKTISNIEFNTEAYNGVGPDHNFTFDTVDFWNDYQSNSIDVDFRMYGQSSLKKKFRIWRVNMIRNSYRMRNRDVDMISNPWTYMKLSCNTENTNKLTLHWININYR